MRTHQKELATLLPSVHPAAQETEGEGQLLSFFSDRVPVIKCITSTVRTLSKSSRRKSQIFRHFPAPGGYM
jgi:hypothetical protein